MTKDELIRLTESLAPVVGVNLPAGVGFVLLTYAEVLDGTAVSYASNLGSRTRVKSVLRELTKLVCGQ
jgi:hypothetical protein